MDAPKTGGAVVDGPSAMAAEGIPYQLGAFTQIGTLPDDSGFLDRGGAWQPAGSVAKKSRHREFPVNNAIVTFP